VEPVGSKYLFVINSLLAGGAERSLLDLIPWLIERDVVPIIACVYGKKGGFEDEALRSGLDVRVLPGRHKLAKIMALRQLIRRERPSLVYTALFDSDVLGRIAAIGMNVPVMTNLANTAYDDARLGDPNVNRVRLRIAQWIDGFTARHLTDHFHAISHAVKESTVAHLGVAPEKITVVKRGRDARLLGEPSDSRRSEVRKRLRLDQDAEVILAVGRQEYQKGHRYLIDAFAHVITSSPRARLVVAGRKGHATLDLAQQVGRLGLSDVVTILGHRDDIADVMAAADLFVFPSLYEGLGGALIEAMALGLPVVASDLPALREVVRAGENADLVAPGDAHGLAQAILGLLHDTERRLMYAERSRSIFSSEFQADIATERTLDLLARAARAPHTA
jgi:glycosyltransferase involved in cell wall biosynthesis